MTRFGEILQFWQTFNINWQYFRVFYYLTQFWRQFANFLFAFGLISIVENSQIMTKIFAIWL